MKETRFPELEYEARPEPQIEIDPASPTPGFDYLCATVRDPRREHHDRARAARELLPFEKAKLSAMAIIPAGGDFATRLDTAIERSNAARLINGNADPNANAGSKIIEHRASEGQSAEGSPKGVRRL